MPTPTANQYAGTQPVPYTNTGPTPAFLPDTPMYQHGLRSLTDQYNSTMSSLQQQRSGLMPAYQQQYARMGNDVQSARRTLNNSMASRGIYNSSARGVLDRQDIQTPYSRNLQDTNQQMQSAYSQLAQGEQGANLAYQQGLSDLLLQRAAYAAYAQPYGLPQTGPQDRNYQMYDYWFDPNNVTAPYGSPSAFV